MGRGGAGKGIHHHAHNLFNFGGTNVRLAAFQLADVVAIHRKFGRLFHPLLQCWKADGDHFWLDEGNCAHCLAEQAHCTVAFSLRVLVGGVYFMKQRGIHINMPNVLYQRIQLVQRAEQHRWPFVEAAT